MTTNESSKFVIQRLGRLRIIPFYRKSWCYDKRQYLTPLMPVSNLINAFVNYDTRRRTDWKIAYSAKLALIFAIIDHS